MSVRPSVSLSHQSNATAACVGFAAERRTRKIYRSTAPGARQQQPGAAARRLAANTGTFIVYIVFNEIYVFLNKLTCKLLYREFITLKYTNHRT